MGSTSLGNLDQALAYLKSLELKPDNPDALMNLGGSTKTLATLIRRLPPLKSLELKPDNPTAHMNLGGSTKTDNLDQALASTLKSLELKPKPPAHMNLGSIYNHLKIEQASESFAKAYELLPNIRNACRAKLFFPWTLNDQDDIETLRSTYIRNAEQIFKDDPQEQKQFLELSLFALAYQNGKDDRNFLELISKLVRPYLQVESDEEHRNIWQALYR